MSTKIPISLQGSSGVQYLEIDQSTWTSRISHGCQWFPGLSCLFFELLELTVSAVWSVLLSMEIEFPYRHDIKGLLRIAETSAVEIPSEVNSGPAVCLL